MELSGQKGDTNPIVDGKLILEEMNASMVDRVSSITIVLLSGIHRAPLSVPHAQSTLIQPLPLLLICPDETSDLVLTAVVRLRGIRKPVWGVIVNRVRRVLPFLYILVAEMSEIRCEGVPIQEQDVVRIDRPDRIV